ncbi:MAG: hypothetical protein QW409_02710 [Candidatus Aenigmatarchaeota archaeon]
MEKNLYNFKMKINMMKRGIISLILIIFVFNLLIVKSLDSSSVFVDVQRYVRAVAGDTLKIPIKITNPLNSDVKVFLSLFPPYFEGISAYIENNEILVKANSQASTNLIIKIPITSKERIVTYKIFVEYYHPVFGKTLDVYEISLEVSIKNEIIVEDFGINNQILKPGDELNIYVKFRNLKDYASNVKVVLQKLYESKTLASEKEYSINVLSFSTETFTYNEDITLYTVPGKYSYVINSYDEANKLISKLVFDVEVKEVRNVTKVVNTEQTFWEYKITVQLKNNGNVEESIKLEEKIPTILRYFTVFKDLQPEISGDIAIWNINLKPGEEVKFSYSILYWIPISVISLIALLVFMFFFFFYLVPIYTKKVEKQEEMYKIKLVIKNRKNKKMKNIEIKDFVPSLFSIVSFETLKPIIKKTKDGYELTWKIRELKPREEIIISYTVKPLVEIIGEVKFSKPKIKYVLR